MMMTDVLLIVKSLIVGVTVVSLGASLMLGRALLNYIARSLWTRKWTTILTLGGVSLVVFVFAAVLMLAHGVEQTMIESGSDENVIALRRAANSELVSQIDRDAANILATQPEVALTADGKPVATTEAYTVINLHKTGSNDMGNVSVRGVTAQAFQLRPQVRLLSGNMFRFGTREIVVGSNIASRFAGCEIGRQLKFGDDQWTIVGHFEADGSAFESEVWGDADQLMPAFGRPVFSSMTVKLNNAGSFDALKKRIEADPRTQYLELKIERTYYREQSQMMADFIYALGLIITFIFSIGAVIGAMITMFGAIANRTVEIGTLRSLGFRRRNILAAFLVESVFLAVIGGIIGIVLALGISFVRISTINFSTFSELAFGFTMSPSIIFWTMVFSIGMGVLGGFFPAVRAARLNIVNALRSS